MKNKFTIIVFMIIVAILASNQQSHATHAMGADITYKCLGGNTYQFTYSFYYDCSSTYSMPNHIPVSYYSTSCNIFNVHFNLTLDSALSFLEVTPICPNLHSTFTDSNSIYPGVKQFIYKGNITLPQQCTDWTFAYAMAFRNGNINTITTPGADNLTVFALLNNTISPGNNSSDFTSLPVPYICMGQTYCYNDGAVDPDGDSLAYSLMTPLTGPSNNPFSTSVTYSNIAFNATNPISSNPVSIFNALDGTICMTPSALDVGVMAILVKEYRHGVLIGEVERDIQINVMNCINNIPTLSGINGSPTNFNDTVCAQVPITFQIFSNDLDSAQIDTMWWDNSIAGATFTVTGSPHPIGTFSWIPPSSAANTVSYCFTVTVRDNACPYEATQTNAYCLRVVGVRTGFKYINLCNTVVNFIDTSFIPSGTITGWHWLFGDPSSGVNDSSNLQNPTHNFSDTGNFTVRLITTSSWGCSDTAYETVHVVKIPFDVVHLGNDTSVCNGVTLTLNAGNPGAIYSWSTGATSQTIQVTTTGAYWGKVQIDACADTDTIVVTFIPPPIVNLGNDTILCIGQPITLNAGNAGATFLWNTGATTQTISPTTTGSYSVTVTNSIGCRNEDI